VSPDPQITVAVWDGETVPISHTNGFITTRRYSGRRILVPA